VREVRQQGFAKSYYNTEQTLTQSITFNTKFQNKIGKSFGGIVKKIYFCMGD
jgi:hypothetical protein